MSKPLENMRHERFCQAYVVSFNGKKAALEAGYKEHSVQAMASQLLARRDIRKRLRALQKDFFQAKKLEREEVIQQLYYLCTRDVLDFADHDTGVINVDDLRRLPKGLRASIDGLRVRQLYDKSGEVIGQEITLNLSPKAKAIEMAMKHFSLFAPEEVDHKHSVSVDWDRMFESQAGKVPEVEEMIQQLPEKGTLLITKQASP